MEASCIDLKATDVSYFIVEPLAKSEWLARIWRVFGAIGGLLGASLSAVARDAGSGKGEVGSLMEPEERNDCAEHCLDFLVVAC
jgi:hypothetical protein